MPGGAWSTKLDFNIVKSETLTESTFNSPLQIPATDATVLIPIEAVSTWVTLAKFLFDCPGTLKLTKSPIVVIPANANPGDVTVDVSGFPVLAVIDAMPMTLAAVGTISAVNVDPTAVIPNTDWTSDIVCAVTAVEVLASVPIPLKTSFSPIWKSPLTPYTVIATPTSTGYLINPVAPLDCPSTNVGTVNVWGWFILTSTYVWTS